MKKPSDHSIEDDASFIKTINDASELDKQGNLVALGVVPSWGSSEYGYLEAEAEAEAEAETKAEKDGFF